MFVRVNVSGRVTNKTIFWGLIFMKMDVFSLEDEDNYSGLFITQEVSQNKWKILGDPSNFGAPLVSLTSKNECATLVYEDISDDDFVDIPSSQVPKTGNANDGR